MGFMNNFFSNLFGRNYNPESIVSFDVLDKIYAYLYNEQNRFDFRMKGVSDNVFVNLYSFPDSFAHEEGRNEINNSGFKNVYEVLNELNKRVGITEVSEEDRKETPDYDYIHIQFFSNRTPEMKGYLNYISQNFIIFFCCTNSSEANDFKILHTISSFDDYVKGLLETEYVDLSKPKSDLEKIGFKDFENVLQGICEYLKIELPENLVLPSSESLMFDAVTIEDFEEFLRLISRGDLEGKLLKNQAKVLFENYGREDDEEEYEEDFDFFEGINCWYSDWKFDPEDAEWFVSEMLGETFSFEYPEETYSHNLFPYIQAELTKQNLELMNYDTKGDSYLFFIVKKEEVNRIIELSELTKMEIHQL